MAVKHTKSNREDWLRFIKNSYAHLGPEGLAGVILAKISADECQFQNFNEIIEIVRRDFPSLSIRGDPNVIDLKYLNNVKITKSNMEILLNYYQTDRKRGLIEVGQNVSQYLSNFFSIQASSKIADLSSNLCNIVFHSIKNIQFKGQIHIFSENQVYLLLNLLRYRFHEYEVNLHLTDKKKGLFVEDKFDLIYHMYFAGMYAKNKPSFKRNYIDFPKEHLSETGEYVLIVPNGFSFWSSWKDIRSEMLNQFNIKAILTLSSAFSPMTNVDGLMLILSRRQNWRQKTFMAKIDFKDETMENPDICLNSYREHLKGNRVENEYPIIVQAQQQDLHNDFNIMNHNPKLARIEREVSSRYEIRRLGDICDIHSGSNRYRSKEYLAKPNNEVAKFIRIKDIADKKVDLDKVKYVIPKSNKDTLTKTNDILFSNTGTISKLAIVDEVSQGSIVSKAISILRPKEGQIIPEYLIFALESSYVWTQIKAFSHGVSISHISNKQLKDLKVPLVEYEKQKKLVTEINDLTHELQQLSSKQKEIQKKLHSLIKETFS